MSRVSRARRIAMAAAYGGGGIGVLGAMATGLLMTQAKRARRAIPVSAEPPPASDGVYGAGYGGTEINLLVLGDSSAAGLGAGRPEFTPGALLGVGLANAVRRPVRVRCVAVVGAVSADLHGQTARALGTEPALGTELAFGAGSGLGTELAVGAGPAAGGWTTVLAEPPPDLAVIFIGGNDVTTRVRPGIAVRHLAQNVRKLRAAGAEVIVGTCPDLGTIRPIEPPLRWLARRWSREMAAAQTIAVVEAGGRTVSLGDLLGPEFAASPDRLFAADRFHPSGDGYAAASAAMLPTVVAAVTGTEERAGLVPGERVRSLPQAAVEAAAHAGTEVRGTELAGRERGPWGRWAQLRRRVRLLVERPAPPSPAVAFAEDEA